MEEGYRKIGLITDSIDVGGGSAGRCWHRCNQNCEGELWVIMKNQLPKLHHGHHVV